MTQSLRSDGSYIGYNRVTTTAQDSASGIWSLAAAERRQRAGAWPIVGGDPYFANVLLLLHMDGSGSTFTDSSSYARTITAYAGATQSSLQSKFGGKSLYLPSASSSPTSDRLELSGPEDFNFGTDDFVIEAFVFFEGFSNEETIVAKGNNYNEAFRLVAQGNRNLCFLSDSQNIVTANNVLSVGNWHYIAASRSSGVLRLYVDGVMVASGQLTRNLSNNIPVTIGNYAVFGNYSNYDATLDGFIDELRITKGTDRGMTGSTITVPTAAFPDASGPSTGVEVSYLVVAGGGGGGAVGGGGGAGGYLTASGVTVTPGTQYTVTVGGGGVGFVGPNTSGPQNGSDSSFGPFATSTGGGKGGAEFSSTPLRGAGNGGSGGGSVRDRSNLGLALGLGTAGQGNNGGDNSSNFHFGGGGGGAGGVGGNGTNSAAGAGGAGLSSSIAGSSVERAGGGGGSGLYGGASAATGGGGAGGGGNWSGNAGTPSAGAAGVASTGGGGGGGGFDAVASYQSGGAGGSGVVIIRSAVAAASTTGSPTVTTVGSDTVYTFTGSGSITF